MSKSKKYVSKLQKINLEISEIDTEIKILHQRIADVTEDTDFETIQQQISYTINIYLDLVDYLEEMAEELQQLELFINVAKNEQQKLQAKINRLES